MILSLAHYSLFRLHQQGLVSPEDFPKWAKDAGADAIEPLQPWVGESFAVAKAIAASGLPVAAYAAKNDFADPDPALRAAYGESLRRAINYAGQIGAPVVRVFAGDVREGDNVDAVWAQLVDGLSAATNYAQVAGIRLGLENHGQLVGTAAGVINLIQDVRERVGHDTLGATLDIGNFLLAGDEPSDAVRCVAPWAVHVHIKDFRPSMVDEVGGFRDREGRSWQGCGAGEGVIDVHGALEALRSVGFVGAVSLEYEGPEDPTTAVPRSLAWIRARMV